MGRYSKKRRGIVERWPKLENKSSGQRDLEDWLFDEMVLVGGNTQERKKEELLLW